MDQVTTERHLHHGTIALWDVDEPRRIVACELVQPNPIHGEHLVRIGDEFHARSTPDDDRGHHVSRACGVVVENAQNPIGFETHADLLPGLAQRRVDHGLAVVEATTRQRPLGRVASEASTSTAQHEGRASGDIGHPPIQFVGALVGVSRDHSHVFVGELIRVFGVLTAKGLDDHDRDRCVAPTLEREFESIVSIEAILHRRSQGVVALDRFTHEPSVVVGALRRRIGAPTVQPVGKIRLHNDDLGYETNCFVCEPTNDAGLRVPFFHEPERDLVTAEFTLSDAFSGAPTMVHGGVTLAVLDEAMAWACIAIGRQWAVTSETSTKFHRAIYVDKPHLVEAEVVDQTDSEIVTAGRILNLKGVVRAEATATFTALGEAEIKRVVGERGELDDSMKLR